MNSHTIFGNQYRIQPKSQINALYLDDYTPVRTIRVTNCADDIGLGYLRGFFERAAGPVSNIIFGSESTSEDNRQSRVAYVTFAVPEDAAKIIGEANEQIKFTIEQAESEFQPKIDSMAMNFERLNDDCIRHVTSKLDLIDVINLGKTSTRFHTFTHQILRKKTQFSFDSYDLVRADPSINVANLETILEEMGMYIETIVWEHMCANHLDLLSKYCSNVTDFRLKESVLNFHDCSRNKTFFAKLESLTIINCLMGDLAFKEIACSTKLKTLRLSSCDIRGSFFRRWKNSTLTSIKIHDPHVNFNAGALIHFVRNKKMLKFSYDRFTFENCLNLPRDCLSEVQELAVTFSSKSDVKLDRLDFAQFNRLNNLTIDFDDTAFQNKILLAASKIQTLQSLCMDDIKINAETLKCLGTMKNLQRIRFGFILGNLDEQFYTSLPVHLPNITHLILDHRNAESQHNWKWVRDMLSSFQNLKYFHHLAMDWNAMNMILEDRVRLNLPKIEIGICKYIHNDHEKIQFNETNKGAIKVSIHRNF